MDLNYDFDRAERRERTKKFFWHFLGWLISLGIAVGLAYLITDYALEKTNMVGDSMQNTLASENIILIEKLSYRIKPPKRFDVIVFKKDGKEHSYYSIKRVIGLPGETVRIKEGHVYINGELLEEQSVVEDIFLEGLAEEDIILDEDEYFVLGDNRNNSEDSRFANVGNVVQEEIIGRAWLRLNKFGIISKLNLKVNEEKEEQ